MGSARYDSPVLMSHLQSSHSATSLLLTRICLPVPATYKQELNYHRRGHALQRSNGRHLLHTCAFKEIPQTLRSVSK